MLKNINKGRKTNIKSRRNFIVAALMTIFAFGAASAEVPDAESMPKEAEEEKIVIPGEVSKALINLLEDKDVNIAAAETLGKTKNPEAALALIDILKKPVNDENDLIIRAAAEAIGEMGDARAVEPLIGIIKSQNEKYYCFVGAVVALGKIGDPRAVPHIIELLQNEDEEGRIVEIKALGKIGGPQAVSYLIDRTRSLMSKGKRVTFEVASLGWTDDAKAIDFLIELSKDKNRDISKRAIKALGDTSDTRVTQYLIRMLNTTDGYVKDSVLESLAKKRDNPAVVPALLEDIKEKRAWTTVKILGEIGDSRAVSRLIELLESENIREDRFSIRQLFRHLIRSLGKIGDSRATDHIVILLKDNNEYIRKLAAEALGEIGDEKAVPALIDLLENGTPEDRENASLALAKIGGEEAFQVLVKMFKDERYIIKLPAIVALSELGDPRALPLLVEALDDKVIEVPPTALMAMGEIGGKRARQELIKALKSNKDTNVRCAAARALGRFDDINAMRVLVEVAKKDSDIKVRNAAIRALGLSKKAHPKESASYAKVTGIAIVIGGLLYAAIGVISFVLAKARSRSARKRKGYYAKKKPLPYIRTMREVMRISKHEKAGRKGIGRLVHGILTDNVRRIYRFVKYPLTHLSLSKEYDSLGNITHEKFYQIQALKPALRTLEENIGKEPVEEVRKALTDKYKATDGALAFYSVVNTANKLLRANKDVKSLFEVQVPVIIKLSASYKSFLGNLQVLESLRKGYSDEKIERRADDSLGFQTFFSQVKGKRIEKNGSR